MKSEYQSSEEFQRHSNDVFANKAAEAAAKKAEETQSERDRLKKVIDKHISRHNSTVAVRELAKKNKREAQYQLDLSADLVELLEKIKGELR